jgi:glucosamine kinase
MIAVIYSGSQHANWRLADKGKTIASFKTSGINPYFNDEKSIVQLLNKNISLIHHAEEIKRIYFFGAGASNPQLKNTIGNALSAFFKYAKVSIEHDIQGAAIACCKDDEGIVCICGSGSNAAWYNGKKIKPNNYGLGYIMADEGSGNWLGRQLIKAYMNETLPTDIRKKFVKKYDVDRRILLEKVYRQKQPALYLSSFSSFYAEHKQHPYLKETIKQGFNLLLTTYTLPLKKQYPDAPIHFTGSVADEFKEYLQETAAELGLEIKYILREPINSLLSYYSNKN